MTRRTRTLLVALVGLALPASAIATPITYDFQSGEASIDVEAGGSEHSVLSTPLSGTFFTFDAMVPEITDLEYRIQDTIYLGSDFGSLEIDVRVVDGTGFTGAASGGSGSFTYENAGPLDIIADVDLTGGLAGDWGNGGDPVLATVHDVEGTIDIVGDTANVVTQKQISFDFIPFSQHGEVTVTARVDFVGVPEPATTALLLLGLGGLAATARRRAS